MDEHDKERQIVSKRLWGLGAGVLIIIGVLTIRLWNLQIADAAYYTVKAQSNFNQTVSISATRGDILDSTGNILVTSVPKFVLSIEWLELQKSGGSQWQDVIHKLAEYVKPYWPNQKQAVESIYEDILATMQNQQWERYKPVDILQTDDQGLRAIIAEHQQELPGVTVTAQPVRSYPMKTQMGHVLGYVREISDQEIERFNNKEEVKAADFQYQAGDIVGKSGIENMYDFLLRGREGKQLIETDSSGRPIDKKVVEEPEAGKSVQLTINSDLQKVMEESMENVLAEVRAGNAWTPAHPDANAAAAVAIDVNTGKVLAMASHPTMDPNDLIGIISDETAEKYFTDKRAASLNRAISGIYAPGSTFKMITGMAALQSGLTTPEERVNDELSSLGSRFYQVQGFEEWGGNHFGMVNLKQAIAKSANIYFEVMGARVFDKSPEMIKQVANEFGLGVKSGIDLPGEEKGTAPSKEWKTANYTPMYEKQRDDQLAAIEAEYKEKIANAKDESEKKKLEQQKATKINNVNVEFKQNIAQYVEWHYYDSYNNSIGQGYNAYTPLQLANYVAAIVNGGNHYRPYVVDKIIDPVTKKVVQETKPTLLNTVSISPANLQAIKEGMAATLGPGGTGEGIFWEIPNFTGGAKTGTAQIGSKDTIAGEVYNGVFVAFAPYDNPQIAFAGVVEYGGHGGSTAGKIAAAVFKKYFEGQ